MKPHWLVWIFVLALTAPVARPQQVVKPLDKTQLMDLVKAGMETADLVKLIHEHGVDFDLTESYFDALRAAGAQDTVIEALRAARPKPLNKQQILELVVGHVPSERAAALVAQRGIDFVADEHDLDTLRLAGADENLISAVRKAGKAVMAELAVETSPGASVYVDGVLAGTADPQGRFALRTKPGDHALRVTMTGKKDFDQVVALAAPQGGQIAAPLADAPGSIRVRTLAGATVSLDRSARGTIYPSGQMLISDVSPGAHELEITAPGKQPYRQNFTLAAGEEKEVQAPLQDSLLEGSSWAGRNSNDVSYEFTFQPGGILRWKAMDGKFYTNGTWTKQGNSIHLGFNDNYVELDGTITDDHMEGTAVNRKGLKWTWSVDRKP